MNSADSIYNEESPALLVSLTGHTSSGYAGTASIGILEGDDLRRLDRFSRHAAEDGNKRRAPQTAQGSTQLRLSSVLFVRRSREVHQNTALFGTLARAALYQNRQ
jgi:hypothetical protein